MLMFRKMRRFKQLLTKEETVAIFERGQEGILAVQGDDGYPYAVPVNYIYKDGEIYFHGGTAGHRYDALKRCDKVSFCVIDKNTVVPEKVTTYFRSAVAFGRAHILEGDEETANAARMLAYKYSADFPDAIEEEIRTSMGHLCCVRIDIEHMTGKQAIELVK